MKHLIQKGVSRKPINMILHGTHGIGKSTFGANANNPIFVTGEEIEEVDANKFPKCLSWDDFIGYIKFIRDDRHDYKTLVIDTLDSIESLLHKHIIKEDEAKDMATACGGFGKSYTLANQMFTELRDEYLSVIREKRNMNIIMLCHSTKNKVEDPLTMSSYDVFEMKLHKNSKGFGAYTIFSEWVSIIAFANFIVYRTEDKKTKKDYAIGDGERTLFCSPKPAYDAKNRFNFPDEMILNWQEMAGYVDLFYSNVSNPEVELIKSELRGLVVKIKDETLKNETIANILSIGNNLERLTKAKEYILGIINKEGEE